MMIKVVVSAQSVANESSDRVPRCPLELLRGGHLFHKAICSVHSVANNNNTPLRAMPSSIDPVTMNANAPNEEAGDNVSELLAVDPFELGRQPSGLIPVERRNHCCGRVLLHIESPGAGARSFTAGAISDTSASTNIQKLTANFCDESPAFPRFFVHFTHRHGGAKQGFRAGQTHCDAVFTPLNTTIVEVSSTQQLREPHREGVRALFGLGPQAHLSKDDFDAARKFNSRQVSAEDLFYHGAASYMQVTYTGEAQEHVNVWVRKDGYLPNHGVFTESIRNLGRHLGAHCTLHFLFEGGSNFSSDLNSFVGAFRQRAANPNAIRVYYPTGADYMFIQANRMPLRNERPATYLSACMVFPNRETYLIKVANAAVCERENTLAPSTFSVRAVIATPPSMFQTRLLLLDMGRRRTIPAEGDVFMIDMPGCDLAVDNRWRGTVLPHMGGMPLGRVLIFATRPTKVRCEDEDDSDQGDTPEPTQQFLSSSQCLYGLLLHDPIQAQIFRNADPGGEYTRPIRLMRQVFDSQYKAIYDAFFSITHPIAGPLRKNLVHHLLGRSYSAEQFVRRDPPQDLDELLSGVKEDLQFDDQQAEAFDSIAAGTNGVAIIQGPPGAGKTRLAIYGLSKVARIYNSNILVVGPVNELLNRSAAAYQAQHPDDLVVRIHSPSTEKELLMLHNEGATRKKQALAPNLFHSDGLQSPEDLHLYGQVIINALNSYRSRPLGVADKRVVSHDFTMATAILKVTGFIESCHNMVDVLRADATLTRVYNSFADGLSVTNPSKDERSTFSWAIAELRRFVIEKCASVIFCNEVQAGTVYVHGPQMEAKADRQTVRADSLKPSYQPMFVIHDESGRQQEIHTAPAFLNYPKSEHIFLTDPNQIAPIVTSEPEHPHMAQMKVPLVTRLKTQGARTFFLTVQHRAEECLVQDLVQPFYNFPIGTSLPSTRDPARGPTARLAIRLIIGRDRVRGSPHYGIMVVDPIFGPLPTPTTSKACEGTAFACIAAVRKAVSAKIKPEHIAVLTPYRLQYQLLCSLFPAFPFTAGVFIGTVDSTQGGEFRFVILDMPNTESFGFLNAERLVTAISRAQDGFVAVVSGSLLYKMRPKNTPSRVREVITALGTNKIEVHRSVIQKLRESKALEGLTASLLVSRDEPCVPR